MTDEPLLCFDVRIARWDAPYDFTFLVDCRSEFQYTARSEEERRLLGDLMTTRKPLKIEIRKESE